MRISAILGDLCYKSQLTVSFRNYIGSMQIKHELVVQQDSQFAKTICSLKNDVIYNIVHGVSRYSIDNHTFGDTQRDMGTSNISNNACRRTQSSPCPRSSISGKSRPLEHHFTIVKSRSLKSQADSLSRHEAMLINGNKYSPWLAQL